MVCLVALQAAEAAQPNDEFIRGYATAVIAEHFPSAVGNIRVQDGTVYIEGARLTETEKSDIRKMLSDVVGAGKVGVIFEQAVPTVARVVEELPMFLPTLPLFHPLLADPRWPHFSISYQRYVDDDLLRNVADTSFGESFSIYRFQGPWETIMEIGIQAGVFAIFDLDAESFDLINADYLVGIPITVQKGDFTNMLRIFHQSSHLGDEFLLRGDTTERINLSYESLDNLLSYDLPGGLRLYGGAGYLFRRFPSDLEPWSTQVGLEYRSPKTWLGGALRPVGALDLQNHQESDWNTDLSASAGIQFENPDFLSRKLMLLLKYYKGKSPNGQFYESGIEFAGLGVHLYF